MSLSLNRSLAYLPHCLLPLLLLAALNYWNGLKTVDSLLSSQAQSNLNSLSGEIDRRLQDERIDLLRVALSSQLRDVLLARKTGEPVNLTTTGNSVQGVPSDLFLNLTTVVKGRAHFWKLAVFDQGRAPLFQIERHGNAQGADTFILRTNDLPVAAPNVSGNSVNLLNESTLRYTVPISAGGPNNTVGTLVGELNLEEVIADSSALLTMAQSSRSAHNEFVIALDPSGKIIYHTNHDLQGKVVSSALPEFIGIADPLTHGTAGLKQFRGSNGADFISAFSPLPQWNIGLAVVRDESAPLAAAHQWGLLGVGLALLGGLGSALVFSHRVNKKSRGIERVEEGLTAIAEGQLDRRIDLKSSDDARAIADNINVVTERLRAQIAREEETRQFQSFVRLSAMLTHDLKNSIEALSLIVGNMERHFDNEQFRSDALRSLTSATDKLKGIVARLTRPLTSLSGEHPRPKSVDLVPIIKRVENLIAEPLREKHTIEMTLPRTLMVFADPERIEKVIENLILNALEAMADKNGSLAIEAGLTSRGAATFSIRDTGSGMSPEFIESDLFRPFSTTKKHGVGLGLYTCREVVEASGGLIEVESEEGVGTTFRVVLPSASTDSRS